MLPIKTSLLPGFSRFFEDDWNNLFNWSKQQGDRPFSSLPAVNIQDDYDCIIIEMAVPGMTKENLSIEAHNNLLIVKAESKNQHDNETRNYQLQEFNYQTFRRSFNINFDVIDIDKVDAQCQNGILKLQLPKKVEAKAKKPREIPIS